MVSSALISYRGFCEEGKRNWFWNREALEGFRSELERLRPWVGSMSCWAFCTMLVKLENMVADQRRRMAVREGAGSLTTRSRTRAADLSVESGRRSCRCSCLCRG